VPADETEARVLVVDDEEEVRRSLARTLQRAGFEAETTESGEEALRRMEAAPPDLVLLDVVLPGLDGYEVCERMQRTEALSYVPVVFVTALEGERDRERAFAAGGSAFLEKPIERDRLLAVVGEQLRTGERWRRLRGERTRQPSWLLPQTFEAFKRYLGEERGLDAEAEEELKGIGPADLYAVGRTLRLPDDQLGRYLARFLEIPFRERVHGDEIDLGSLPRTFCHTNLVVPLEDGTLAVANPFDWELMDTLERTVWRGERPRIALIQPDTIRRLTREERDTEELLGPDPDRQRALTLEAGEEKERAGESGAEALAVANELLRGAVSERASDVHLEPKETGTLVRYRIDGDMHDIRTLDGPTAGRVVSRLKALAGMDIAERRKPQDGSLEATLGQRRFKLRLATSATADGETMVVRILEPDQEPIPLEGLGLAEEQAEVLREMAGRHQGMILIVGPTGSGKSTTIFTLLSTVDGRTRSIMSVEDPIEYRIPYANQQQVHERAGVTFEELLRSAMRQDPDILFLGEVRDPFSARAVLDFASSGHLTVSTLHSSNATTAIFRLERLGIERGAMADAIAGIVAQKLLKTLCPECREVGPITSEERAMLEPFTDEVPEEVARPVGCPACRETGFHGREGVYEILRFDPEVVEMVREGRSIGEIRSFCARRGDFLISRHALQKVRELILPVETVYTQVLLEETRYRSSENEDPAPGAGAASGRETPGGEATGEEATGGEASEEATGTSPTPTETTRILVVEDDPDMSALLRLHLEGAGYDVETADDGVDALMVLGNAHFDAVLSDIQMPNLDGVKLMEMISQKSLDLPTIFVSGQEDEAFEGEVLELGAADYIRKPVRKPVLLLRIRNALLARGVAVPDADGSDSGGSR